MSIENNNDADMALRHLLNQAPDIAPSPDLHKAILATAHRQTPQSDNVIRFRPLQHPPLTRPQAGANWLAGGFMAASLALGVWIGAAGLADPLVSAPLELAGVQTTNTAPVLLLDNMLEGLTISQGAL